MLELLLATFDDVGSNDRLALCGGPREPNEGMLLIIAPQPLQDNLASRIGTFEDPIAGICHPPAQIFTVVFIVVLDWFDPRSKGANLFTFLV